MRKFVFFGGKGGVGKTTISSAYGLKCARDGLETLVVSTDPAHSTSDVFDQPFTDEPAPVDGVDGLHAMEIDPEEESERHLMETKRAMTDQVSAGMVNEIDRQIEMSHQTPGAYEAALMDRFIDVMQSSEAFDRVVFDTSPTGGTLRLLSLPELLEGWIDRLAGKRERAIDLYEKAAIGNNAPRRVMDGDPILARLRGRKERFEFAGETLRERAAFHLVLNPDELSIRETDRAVSKLREYGLEVNGLVVNKLTPDADDFGTGVGAEFMRQRVETERKRLATIETELDPAVVARIELRVAEVKGDLLSDVADELGIETHISNF